jgi:chromate transporter
MTDPAAPANLIGRLALLSVASFGGVPAVLPDLHDYVVAANGWISDRDFANCFAAIQTLPGPNMILMMSFIGWKIGGLGTAIASGLAIFVPSCLIVYIARGFWDRFRDRAWQQLARRGLAPVTIGLVIAGGTVMARAADTGWPSIALTIAAAAFVLGSRRSPLWVLGAAGLIGGLGLL